MDCSCLQAEVNLTGDGEPVRFVEFRGFGIEAARGCEVGQVEGLAEEVKTVAEHVEGSARVERQCKFGKEGVGSAVAIISGDGLPRFRLG